MIVNIYGPSGSGKTTLIRDAIQLNIICELFSIIAKKKGSLSGVPGVTLSMMPMPKFRGSVESYLSLFGIAPEKIIATPRLDALKSTIFVGGYADNFHQALARSVETLSAGEVRRLSILRCILEGAGLIIIDEPFANSNQGLNRIIYEAIDSNGSAILLTHEPIEGDLVGSESLFLVPIDEAQLYLKIGNDL